jgi:hypothetical protein
MLLDRLYPSPCPCTSLASKSHLSSYEKFGTLYHLCRINQRHLSLYTNHGWSRCWELHLGPGVLWLADRLAGSHLHLSASINVLMDPSRRR